MLFALLLLKKELKVFMLYVSFNHAVLIFIYFLMLVIQMLLERPCYSCCTSSNLGELTFCALVSFVQGYGSFLLRDLPFDAIQFCIYEQLRIGYKLAVFIQLMFEKSHIFTRTAAYCFGQRIISLFQPRKQLLHAVSISPGQNNYC